MTQEELINCLEKINFTKLESQIYLALLEGGPMSAYQLAKKIDISRPSIYNALEHMYDKGSVTMIPENTALYVSQEPDVLLEKLNSEFEKNTNTLLGGLKDFMDTRHEERFENFRGFETIISKAKKIISSAESEVYINTDFDLQIFKEEFAVLKQKGVRVIAFSFYKLNVDNLDVEFFSHYRMRNNEHKPERLMIAVDSSVALLADCYKARESWLGTVTNNALMISIICEHIHHDIYLLKLENKYGTKEVYNTDLMIHSLFENRSRINGKKKGIFTPEQ